jgi:hypothetical protein
MSRRNVFLDAMVRELGAACYRALHGKGSAAEVTHAVASVDAEEARVRGGRPAGPRRAARGRRTGAAAA